MSTWKPIKLVEKCHDGNLTLLADNLKTFIQGAGRLVGTIDAPLVLMSTLGPPRSGKSFLTNLFSEFLLTKKQGWGNSVTSKASDLRGVSYYGAVEGNQYLFTPDDEADRCGVYFWPVLYALDESNAKNIMWIMHAHHRSDECDKTVCNMLNYFLLTSSSALVDIVFNQEKPLSALLSEQLQEPLKKLVCTNITYLIRNEYQEKGNTFTPKDKTYKLAVITPFKNDDGKLKFELKQLRVLNKAMRSVLDPVHLKPKRHNSGHVSLSNLEGFLTIVIGLINSHCNQSSKLAKTAGAANGNILSRTVPSLNISTGPETETSNANASRVQTIIVNQIKASDHVKDHFEDKNSTQKEKGIVITPTKGDTTLSTSLDNAKILRNVAQEKPVVMREIIAKRPIWKMMHEILGTWVENELQHGISLNVEPIFKKCLRDMYQQELRIQQDTSPVVQSKEFQEFFKTELTKKYKDRFSKVPQSIDHFCQIINTHFYHHTISSGHDLQQKLNSILEKITDSFNDDDVVSLVTKGCQKLFSHYFALFEENMREETSVKEKCSDKIQLFYRKQFQTVIDKDKYHHPDNLTKVHNNLINSLKEVYKRATNSSKTWVTVEKLLTAEFEEFKRKNFSKIESTQKDITSLVAKQKSEYEIQMNNFLQDHSSGVSSDRLAKKHASIAITVLDLFRKDIKDIIHNNENFICHEGILKAYIEKSRCLFDMENDALREEAAENQQTEIPLIPHPVPTISVDAGSKSPSIKTSPDPATLESNLTILPSLLLHLGWNRIGVGYINSDNNCISSDITYIPANIALTHNDEWLIGEELQNQLALNSNILKKQWHLGQCFSTIHLSNGNVVTRWSDELFLENKVVTITVEFILAMVLQKIKQRYQVKKNGQATSVMISIPFWFCSFQRQQVLDAATISGFESVQILNENTVAAYFIYYSEVHKADCDTVVISENSSRVDISLYSYDPGYNKITMLGHAGDYESNPMIKKGGWLQYIPGYSFLARVWNAQNIPDAKNDEQIAIQNFVDLWRKVYNFTETHHYTFMSNKRKVLISCENDSCTGTLEKVARRVPECIIHVQHNAALFGLSSLYQAATEKHKTVKSLVKDGVPFYLHIVSPDGRKHTVIKKRDLFVPVSKPMLVTTCCALKGTYIIFQENDAEKLPVGQIIVTRSEDRYSKFHITLRRTHDNRIRFHCLEWSVEGYINSHKGKVPTEYFQWHPYNMNNEDKTYYINLLHETQEVVEKTEKLPNTHERIEIVKAKASSLLVAINTCKGSFPGPIVKELILKQVTDVLSFLGASQVTDQDVNAKEEFLNNILDKYQL